ncbi:MAG: Holliday junction resolvase RuvX [Deltaproteobacteria bacterium]|nr:Holliday junction resolvase RuvX [Candidatus Zymogenaceae bacterium]
MRLLGLDVGEKRIGVAVTDPTGIFTQPISTIMRGTDDIEKILDLVREYDITEVVVGLPVNMNGTLGPGAQKVQEFAQRLEAVLTIPIVFEDERLTTSMAERMMIDADVSRKKRKRSVDKIAAAIILEGRLEKIKANM